MLLLQISSVIGLVLALASNVYSMDFSAMFFARDAMMQYSKGNERTVQILKPKLKVVTTPIQQSIDRPSGRRPSTKGLSLGITKTAETSLPKFELDYSIKRFPGLSKHIPKLTRFRPRPTKAWGSKRKVYSLKRRKLGTGPRRRKTKFFRYRFRPRPTKAWGSKRKVYSLKRRKLGTGPRRRKTKFFKYRFKRPLFNRRPKTVYKLTFINQTKTYRSRTTPSNKFLKALSAIERGVAEAKVARSKLRFSDQKLRSIKKTIKLAVENRMYQYARHRLGQALFLIKELNNASRTSRSKRSTANQASTFINDLKAVLGPARFDKFMAVMGDVTLMFAIDTTGSMSDEIDTAKRIAVDVINHPRENPVNYILSPFNDPKTGPVTFKETTEGALFVDAINKLSAYGGGDCPELTITGILNAMYEGPDPGSPLYVFTDASAKDASPESINEVKSMAKFLGNVVINFFNTGQCGLSSFSSQKTNPFMEIAEATSGQLLPLANTSELQQLNGFTGSVLGGSNIISSGSNISNRKKRAAPTASMYGIKIDDSIENISICITTEGSYKGTSISLRDPQGITITSGKVSLKQVSIYEIKSPRVGTWTLVIPPTAGVHNYFVKSNSDTNIDFDYYFLMLMKEPASEVPVTDPLKGQKNKVVLTIAGARKIRNNTVVLELITKYGEFIQNIKLTPDNRRVHYTATFIPPSRPFKLKIKGITKSGNPFERISHSIVEPKYVQLRVLHSVDDFTLRKGKTSTVTFQLYNAATVNKLVNIRVKDRLGYARLKNSARTIRRGRWAFFGVFFDTPLTATVGASDTAFVSVSVNDGEEIVSQPVQLLVIE